jgi:hypothetical protein
VSRLHPQKAHSGIMSKCAGPARQLDQARLLGRSSRF